jgi:hypothetical protein
LPEPWPGAGEEEMRHTVMTIQLPQMFIPLFYNREGHITKLYKEKSFESFLHYLVITNVPICFKQVIQETLKLKLKIEVQII